QGVFAVDEHLHELARSSREGPILNEEQPEPGSFLLRRAPPVHGNGDEINIELRVVRQGRNHLLQLGRRATIDSFVPKSPWLTALEIRAQVPCFREQPLLWPRQLQA